MVQVSDNVTGFFPTPDVLDEDGLADSACIQSVLNRGSHKAGSLTLLHFLGGRCLNVVIRVISIYYYCIRFFKYPFSKILTIHTDCSRMKGLTSKNPSTPVIAIGSGNLENILISEGAVCLGQKHLVSASELIGGSSINCFLRMAMAGYDAFPIPQIGNDDIGIQIQARLLHLGQKINLNAQIMDFISSPDFLIPEIQTAKATIVVHDGRRTIFSQMHSGSDIARNHVIQQYSFLKARHKEKASLIIGHVPLDRQPHRDGFVTRRILSMTPSDWLTLINPGPSQYQWGLDYWEKELRQVDIVQFNLFEIRKFFSISRRPNSLSQIIDYLAKASINAIITLNKFGAIGLYNGSESRVIIAEPLHIRNVVDPTGAGDAFASGLVCALNGKKNFSFQEFVDAIQTGRLWASYACTTLGASGDCPNAAQLSEFKRLIKEGEGAVHIFNQTDDNDYLNRIEHIS